ncbi:MAG: hypothetical protein IIY71_01630, partial [Oscillospiraceae bacterium]|nr:hypothetical protein [Oscillospiraceae bacterium]
MKQGTLATKVIMAILFLGTIVYLAVYAIRSLSSPYQTEPTYVFQVEELVTAKGYLARTETVLPTASGLVEVSPREGERVGKDQTIATMYSNRETLEQHQKLNTLNAQLEQLQNTASSAEDALDKARLDTEIVASIVSLHQSVADQSLAQLSSASFSLKNLVFQREYTADQNVEISALVDNLAEQIRQLESSTAQKINTVSAPESGLYSSLVDGYETVLTEESILSLTPSAFRQLAPETPASGVIGKLITDNAWYFIALLSEEDGQKLQPGRTTSVRFIRDLPDTISMKVVSVSDPENGEVVAVFSCSRYLSQITLLRQTSADIILSSCSG